MREPTSLAILASLIVVVGALPAVAGPAGSCPDGTLVASFSNDTDCDNTVDINDFCSVDPEAPSPCGFDDDMDGYGNRCDGDFNNDGATDFNDVPGFAAGVGNGGPGPTDMNCDGATDFNDVPLFGAQLGAGAPGPSGLPCAGVVPCP